jgi:hypothetical protein
MAWCVAMVKMDFAARALPTTRYVQVPQAMPALYRTPTNLRLKVFYRCISRIISTRAL